MKLRFVSVAALSLVAACATQKGAESSEPEANATIEVEPNAPPPPVQLNDVQGDGFTFRSPGTPQAQRSQVQMPAGNATTATWRHTEGDVNYILTYVDYPQKMVQENAPGAFLTEARDGIANQVKGKVENRREDPLNGFPGERFSVTAQAGNRVDARTAIVNGRLYTMLVVHNPAAPARAAEEFLGSLKVDAQNTADGGTMMGGSTAGGTMDGGSMDGGTMRSGSMDAGTTTRTDGGTRR